MIICIHIIQRVNYLDNVVLETIKSLRISPNYMVGQGYDRVDAMSGNFNGV